MSDLKTIDPKLDRQFLTNSPRSAPEDLKQRKLMLGSLTLLLVALGIVLWHNRDFWFPDSGEDDAEQIVETVPATKPALPRNAAPVAASPRVSGTLQPKHAALAGKVAAPPAVANPAVTPPAASTTTRTVLPPLEVEVVAGDSHRTVRPGSNSVRVDLQPGTSPQPVTEPQPVTQAASGGSAPDTAASVTTNAAEHVQMSAGASSIVTSSVRPNYPLLARQMKVQGSVILQALIGRDGIIQNLHVISGPHILASAAEDAVRQWHFKPHFEGAEAVETQAKITVNFTISTN